MRRCGFDGDIDDLIAFHVVRILSDVGGDLFLGGVGVSDLYLVGIDNFQNSPCNDEVCGGLGCRFWSGLGHGLGGGLLGDGNERVRCCGFDGDVDGLIEFHVVRLLSDGVGNEFVRGVFELDLYPIGGEDLRYFTWDHPVGGRLRFGHGLGGGLLGDGNERVRCCGFDGDVDGLIEFHVVRLLSDGVGNEFVRGVFELNLDPVFGKYLRYLSCDDAVGGRRSGLWLGCGLGSGFLGNRDEFERCYLFNSNVNHLTGLHVVRLLGDGVRDEFVRGVFELDLDPVFGKYLRYLSCDDAVGGRLRFGHGFGDGLLGNRNERVRCCLFNDDVDALTDLHLVCILCCRPDNYLFIGFCEFYFYLVFVHHLGDLSHDGNCCGFGRGFGYGFLADRFESIWGISVEDYVDSIS